MNALHIEVMTKLRILKKLMDSQGEWVSTAELSKELNMNVSKMRQLLKHFLDDLEELNVDIRIKNSEATRDNSRKL